MFSFIEYSRKIFLPLIHPQFTEVASWEVSDVGSDDGKLTLTKLQTYVKDGKIDQKEVQEMTNQIESVSEDTKAWIKEVALSMMKEWFQVKDEGGYNAFKGILEKSDPQINLPEWGDIMWLLKKDIHFKIINREISFKEKRLNRVEVKGNQIYVMYDKLGFRDTFVLNISNDGSLEKHGWFSTSKEHEDASDNVNVDPDILDTHIENQRAIWLSLYNDRMNSIENRIHDLLRDGEEGDMEKPKRSLDIADRKIEDIQKEIKKIDDYIAWVNGENQKAREEQKEKNEEACSTENEGDTAHSQTDTTPNNTETIKSTHTLEEAKGFYKMVWASPQEIQKIQQALVDASYTLGTYGKGKNGVDGKFGPKTFAALKEFQENRGLQQDGKAGDNTLRELFTEEEGIRANTFYTALSNLKPAQEALGRDETAWDNIPAQEVQAEIAGSSKIQTSLSEKDMSDTSPDWSDIPPLLGEHIVESWDSLWKIVKKHYNLTDWSEIAKVVNYVVHSQEEWSMKRRLLKDTSNDGIKWDILWVGDKILLPPKSDILRSETWTASNKTIDAEVVESSQTSQGNETSIWDKWLLIFNNIGYALDPKKNGERLLVWEYTDSWNTMNIHLDKRSDGKYFVEFDATFDDKGIVVDVEWDLNEEGFSEWKLTEAIEKSTQIYREEKEKRTKK